MALRDIAVRVEESAASAIGGIRPILREIEALLAALVETGLGGSIDLRSLPLSPADAEALDAALGEGEVRATIRALGETHVLETAIHGVWRVKHCNDDGNAVADFIEVCDAPDILKTHGRRSGRSLRGRAQGSQAARCQTADRNSAHHPQFRSVHCLRGARDGPGWRGDGQREGPIMRCGEIPNETGFQASIHRHAVADRIRRACPSRSCARPRPGARFFLDGYRPVSRGFGRVAGRGFSRCALA